MAGTQQALTWMSMYSLFICFVKLDFYVFFSLQCELVREFVKNKKKYFDLIFCYGKKIV